MTQAMILVVITILIIVAYLLYTCSQAYESEIKIVQMSECRDMPSHRHPIVLESDAQVQDIQRIFPLYRVVPEPHIEGRHRVKCNYMAIQNNRDHPGVIDCVTLTHPGDNDEEIIMVLQKGYTIFVPRWWTINVPQGTKVKILCVTTWPASLLGFRTCDAICLPDDSIAATPIGDL